MVSGLPKNREKEEQVCIFGKCKKLEPDSSQFSDM